MLFKYCVDNCTKIVYNTDTLANNTLGVFDEEF